MTRNLVLVRVGANSLHPTWISDGAPRDWDLHLLPFQPIPEAAHAGCTVHDVIVGPKWSGLRELLNSWDGWRDYDHIWLPDDDIAATGSAITRMFEVAAAMGLDLFAPALDEDSHFAHFDTITNTNFFGRWVGFVEIMVPGFSRTALEKLLPTLDLSETGWGWGLDSVWPKLLDYKNVAVLDGITITHTRPVGQMRDVELRDRVLAESDKLLDTYDCSQVHATFGVFDESLQPLELAPAELLLKLVDGWRSLIEKDPRLLAWIVEFQRPYFEWPDYPVAGTP